MATTDIRPHKPQHTGTVRIFENPILEALTRTHISLPLSIFFLISAWLVSTGVRVAGLAIWEVAGLFAVGFLFFTWIEYMAHRHIYHMEPTTDWKKDIQYKFHGVHHDYPKDKSRLAMPPLVSVILAGVLFFLFKLVMGNYVFGFLPGLLMGYSAYLWVHYMVHAFRAPKNFFKVLWENHGLHHHKYSDKAYGVSSPLWDYVYGTMPPKR